MVGGSLITKKQDLQVLLRKLSREFRAVKPCCCNPHVNYTRLATIQARYDWFVKKVALPNCITAKEKAAVIVSDKPICYGDFIGNAVFNSIEIINNFVRIRGIRSFSGHTKRCNGKVFNMTGPMCRQLKKLDIFPFDAIHFH